MLEKKLYICNDVLTSSSKGRGSVCNTKGIEGGEEGSLLENDEDMYFVFSGSVPGYAERHLWVNVYFLFGGDVFELSCFDRSGGGRILFSRAYGCTMTNSIFSFLFSWTDTVDGYFLTRCCEIIDAFAGYVILCKAAVNVHKVVFSFSSSRRRFSQQIQTETPWFHTSWIHLLGRVTSVSDLWRGRTTFPWG